MRKPLGEIYDKACGFNADFCVKFSSENLPRVQIPPYPKLFYQEKFAGEILASGSCGGFLVFYLFFSGLWTALNELLAAKFYRKDFSEQNLRSLSLPAPHKILRRSCRDFAPVLRRFLGYKARKFRRRILSKFLLCGILPYEISPR